MVFVDIETLKSDRTASRIAPRVTVCFVLTRSLTARVTRLAVSCLFRSHIGLSHARSFRPDLRRGMLRLLSNDNLLPRIRTSPFNETHLLEHQIAILNQLFHLSLFRRQALPIRPCDLLQRPTSSLFDLVPALRV